jgi:hypothetical protein
MKAPSSSKPAYDCRSTCRRNSASSSERSYEITGNAIGHFAGESRRTVTAAERRVEVIDFLPVVPSLRHSAESAAQCPARANAAPLNTVGQDIRKLGSWQTARSDECAKSRGFSGRLRSATRYAPWPRLLHRRQSGTGHSATRPRTDTACVHPIYAIVKKRPAETNRVVTRCAPLPVVRYPLHGASSRLRTIQLHMPHPGRRLAATLVVSPFPRFPSARAVPEVLLAPGR